MDYMIGEADEVEPITEEQARAMWPEAFAWDTLDSAELASMTAQIGLGVKKSECRFIRTAEDSETWDEIEADMAEDRAREPQVQFMIPNEIP